MYLCLHRKTSDNTRTYTKNKYKMNIFDSRWDFANLTPTNTTPDSLKTRYVFTSTKIFHIHFPALCTPHYICTRASDLIWFIYSDSFRRYPAFSRSTDQKQFKNKKNHDIGGIKKIIYLNKNGSILAICTVIL